MMKTSKNIKAYNLYRQYQRATETSIFQCYVTRPSIYKERAEADILEEMQVLHGFDYKIISHNGFMFTCGYRYTDDDGKMFLVYHSKEKREEILLDGDYTGKGAVWYN